MTLRGLTALQVERARPNPNKRREIPDRGKPGLYFVLQPSGKKSWCVRYRRHSDKRSRKYTLPGGFLSLAAARRLAQAALDEVAGGGDPAATKRAKVPLTPGSDDIGAAFREFLSKHIRRKDGRPIRENSRRQMAMRLGFRRDPANPDGWAPTGGGVLAHWQGRAVRSIGRRDILDLVDTLAAFPIKCNRTLATLRTFFKWRMKRDEGLIRSPLDGIEPPFPEETRERVLSDTELAALWRAAEADGYPAGRVVQVLILTGCRRDEVRRAAWPEINLETREWLIPASRVKNNTDHWLPLGDTLVAILSALPRFAGSPLLFTGYGQTLAKQRLDAAMAAELGAKPEPWRMHDIRRSVATGLQRLGVPLEVGEAVLNHRSGVLAGIARIYNRHNYAAEKRQALERWECHIVRIVSSAGDNVVPLHPARVPFNGGSVTASGILNANCNRWNEPLPVLLTFPVTR